MKDLEGAYNSALNSEGSALKENAAYLDSIQGRIDQFNNALQTMWMNFINDEAVKWIVNLGTSVVQLVDKFGLLNTLTGTFTGVKTAIGSIKKELDSINKDPSKILNIFGREKDVQNLKNTADAIENVVSAKEAETMATKEKTVAAGQEAIVDTVAQGAKNADTRATIANTIATWANEKATKALAVAKALLKGLLWAVVVAVSTKAITGFISKLQENFKSAEEKARELREKVDELTDSYKNAKQEFSDNLEILITTDTEGYDDLLSEFEDLAKGVNKYGENISLTSDEYERYKEICEAIVGVNPSIVEGYNSATEAIGNNVGILQSLIDLQKEEARLNAAEYVSYGMYADNDNFKNMADNAINAYDEVKKKYYSVLADGDDDQYNYLLTHAFELNEDVRDTYGNRAQLDDNFAKAAMEFMGIDGDIDTILRDYYDDRGVFLSVGWWDDYVDEIISHRAEFANILTQNGYETDAFLEWADTYQSVGREVEAASDYMINAFLQVPYALKEYDELSSSEQSFITEWIKNNELFKIDNSTTQDDILAAKQTIIDTIRAIANDDYTVDINGTQVTAQSILDQIFSIDASEIDYATYKADIQALIDRLWTAIGGETNTFGFADKNALAVQLGFEYVFEEETEDDNIDKYVKRVAELTGKTEEEVRQYMESQPAIKVERAVEFYLKGGYDSSEVGSLNLKDVFNMPTPMVLDNTTIVQSYSALSEKASNYNDILEQTNEISADNIEVSKEYKDSLSELGFTEEELTECFDENNGLVVKNSKELRRLVKEKKKEIAADTKLAKAQSQLEYYDLVNQLNSTLNSTTNLNSATLSTIDTLLEQIDTVKQAVYQYQLLEDSLLGTTNAFETYQNAQEIDGLNTYGDDYVSMAQTMYDAFYKTGQVGTEVNWAAIEALVPDWVYAGLQSDADKMRAIYEYFNKQILPTLTLDNDQLSLGFENIEDFVNKGITAGVFEGTTEEFDLVEGMNLERAAELMGMTTTQAYALFAELDKYNTSGTENSFLSQLDDSLAGDIMEVTNNIEELNREKIALMEGGVTSDEQQRINEINEELAQCDQQLEDIGATAYTTWQEYTKNDAVLATLGEIEDKQRKLTEKDAIKLGLAWDEVAGKTVQEAYDYYLAKQVELEEPTVMTATLAVENIDDQIANLQSELNDPSTSEQRKIEIEAEVQGLEEDKALIVSTFGLELSEEDQESIEEELSSIEEFTINDKTFKVVADGVSEVNSTLNSIQNYRIRDKSYNVYENVITTNSRRYTMANGTAHVNGTAFKGGSYGAPKTEEALVGELGPEMVVRDGRWFTVGENGAEFTDIRKNDIIFNHKQTEDLLSKGYVTGRGKAYAEGTAYSGLWNPTKLSDTSGSEVASKVSQAAKDISDASDEFSEVFDWIEVRLEEINESINLQSARLENAVGSTNQNAIIDNLISLNQTLHSNLLAAASEYYAYAKELLEKIPEEYRIAAQNGSIAIEKFAGEVDEEILNAIQEYREWVQKGADVTQQAEETLAEISSLAKQAIDNIAADYENKISLQDIKTDQYDAYNDLLETDAGFKSANIYQAIIDENNKNIPILQKQRDEMQAELNKRVKYGQIKKYSQDWYDAVNDIAAVDTKIIELKTDIEDCQDAINELHWDQFDFLIEQLEAVSDEAENLIDILSNKDVVDKDTGEWTEEGITSLGLYAQQMESAEVQAKKYEEEIKYLNKNWKQLGYTEQEYVEKLDELKSGQYDAIKAYNDTKDAIVDLNKERVDAIKNGIEREIESYQKLIEKKKEELDTEKDLYDFQKNVKQQQKDIADIQRKIAALSNDNSSTARAARVKLQAELAEAQANLEDTYYNRSVENQQEALDKELENFQNAKQDEMKGWDEYLENTNQVVADSLATIQSNTDVVYQTLKSMGEEYGLSITESLTSPWKEGENAIQSFSEKFGIAMSATVEELQALEVQFKQTMLEIEQSGTDAITTANQNATTYTATTGRTTGYGSAGGGNSVSGSNSDSSSSSSSSSSSESSSGKSYPYGKASETSGNIKKGAKGNNVKAIQYALNKLGYGNSGTKKVDGVFGSGTQRAVKAFQKAMGISADGIVGKNTRAKFKLKGYASGITETKKDQLALIDELGEELVMRAGANGKLEYLTKGSSVIPADLTANLMSWGSIDPQDMLDRNRPSIGVAPSVINNNVEFKIDASVGTLLKIDEFNGDDPDEVLKMINKALDQHTKNLNNALKRYSR